MRYSKEHKDTTRQRIVEAASRQYRGGGAFRPGLKEIMADAGLESVGGFYRHFESKDELFREALELALASSHERLSNAPAELEGWPWLAKAAEVYLDPRHRERTAEGCALPALAADVARHSPETRQSFEQRLQAIVDQVSQRMPADGPEPKAHAWAFLSTLVGGLLLARGVADDDLAEEILDACRSNLGSPPGESTATDSG